MITICIPTMPQRASTLSRLLAQLEPFDRRRFEVLVHEKVAPMGDKLNEMFARAQGDWVVCVDDDDLIFPALIPTDLPDVDFVGWRILVSIDGRVVGSVSHRLDRDPDATWANGDRGVSPKCLVRTSIARKVPFGNEYTADRQWSRQVQAMCKSGHFVDELVYHYDHHTGAMLGTNPDDRPNASQRDVGTWDYKRGAFTWLA